MGKRTWIRCKCGAKLHAKQDVRICGPCQRRERKGKNVRVQK